MDGWENRYNDLYEFCKLQDIGMVLVNSNEAKRNQGDSYTDMQKHSINEKYDSPYVLDKNHQLADAFWSFYHSSCFFKQLHEFSL